MTNTTGHPYAQAAERFDQVGAPALMFAELLALMVNDAPNRPACVVAEAISNRYTAADLARADLRDVAKIKGVGIKNARRIKAAFEVGRRMIQSHLSELKSITTPADVAALLMPTMGILENEEIHVIALDTRNRVISTVMAYKGTLNSASARMGESFRDAIRANASAVIVAHNHPSGDPSPSAEDIKVTKMWVAAGKLLEIDVLDHLVIGHNRYVSLKERGMMD